MIHLQINNKIYSKAGLYDGLKMPDVRPESLARWNCQRSKRDSKKLKDIREKTKGTLVNIQGLKGTMMNRKESKRYLHIV